MTNNSVSTPVMTKTSRLTDINTLGFWVNNKTGEGFRITEESLRPGYLKSIGYISNSDLFSLVHSDPQAQVVTLRDETSKLRLPVGF